jgi:hypothetical protein
MVSSLADIGDAKQLLWPGWSPFLSGFTPSAALRTGKGFLKLLVEMNSQRIKSTSLLLHESIIKIDGDRRFRRPS